MTNFALERQELNIMFEALDRTRLPVLLAALHAEEDEITPAEIVLTLAALDWMTLNLAFDTENKRETAWLTMRHGLIAHAAEFLNETKDKYSPDSHASRGMAIVDYRWMMTSRQSRIWDAETSTFIDRLPQEGLTALSCDLNVLWMRLAGRIENVRKLQEKKNANDFAAARKSTGNPPAGAGQP